MKLELPGSLEIKTTSMNEYTVTFTNGETVEVEAWTPEAALVIALEDAELEGRTDLKVADVKLVAARQIEL